MFCYTFHLGTHIRATQSISLLTRAAGEPCTALGFENRAAETYVICVGKSGAVSLTARSAGKFWAFYPVSGEIPARSAGKFLGHMPGLCQVFQPGAEGIDMRSVVSKKESCLKSPFAQIFIRSNDLLGRPHCTVPPLRDELSYKKTPYSFLQNTLFLQISFRKQATSTLRCASLLLLCACSCSSSP